jgi:hypothetical protein
MCAEIRNTRFCHCAIAQAHKCLKTKGYAVKWKRNGKGFLANAAIAG